ncbi:hypothetical protein NKG05_03230 [Oerskovia sp. M15]
MISALAHPVYRRLFLAQVVALAGTGLATVALGLLAFDLAGANAGGCWGRRSRSRWWPTCSSRH